MKHIIKLFAPLFLLTMILMSCDTDKEWIYVEPEPQPGVEISGTAITYKTPFKAADIDPATDLVKGMSTTYTWLKAEGDLYIAETDLEGITVNYGKGTKVSDITSALVADGPAFKVDKDGLYYLIYNANIEQLTIMPVNFAIIGNATSGGWENETLFPNVSLDEASSTVTMTGSYPLTNGEMKFRFNNWGVKVPYEESSEKTIHTNLGGLNKDVSLGESSITLKGGGENLKIEQGAQYDVTLQLNLKTGVFSAKAIQGEIIEPEFPENLYMVGEEFGSWTWGSEGVVEMIPVHSTPGAFWTIKYFTAGKGFKWAPQNIKDNWDGSFEKQGENIGFEPKDGNAFVPEDGLYMVYIDMKANKMVIEKPLVYGIGEAFEGLWDNEPYKYPFTIAGKVMNITSVNTKEQDLRMYATSSLAEDVAWWKMEFNIFDGKIVYRAAGNDQDAVPVQAGAKITLDFSTDTGTIE